MTTRTTLDVWVLDLTFPGYMDRYQALAREFEERHPEYEVALKGIGFFTGPKEISDAVAQGNGPAVAEYYYYMSQTARDTQAPDGQPQFTSVERAVGDRTEILGEPVVLGDITQGFRDSYTCQGDLTSMPSVGTTFVQYVNTDLLERAGVSEAPRTWDELQAACQALAAADGGPEHQITFPNHSFLYLQVLAQQGGHLTDQRNGRDGRARKVDLASPEMLGWVRLWKQLHADGHYLHTGGIPDWMESFAAFGEQKVAIRLSSTNDVTYTTRAAEQAGFGLQVVRFPFNPAVPYSGNTIAGSSLWLADRLDDATREGALAFLQFLHNPRNAADRHKDNSCMPLTHSAYALLESEGWFEENPHHRFATEQISTFPEGTGHGTPEVEGVHLGDFAGIQDVLTRAVNDVLLRDGDPVERLTWATEASQRLLDAYNAEAAATGPRRDSSLRFEYFRDGKEYEGSDMEDNVVKLRDAS